MSEIEKLEAGLEYCYDDPEVEARKEQAIIWCREYNAIDGSLLSDSDIVNNVHISRCLFSFWRRIPECRVFIGKKHKMERTMKAFQKVMGITFLVAMTISCSNVENVYDESSWQGEYPVQMENGTTGEMEDHVATIALSFEHNGMECVVETGVVGLYAANRVRYEAQWSGKDTFSLVRSQGGQSLTIYSGTISGDEMALEAWNCDSVAFSCSLRRQ